MRALPLVLPNIKQRGWDQAGSIKMPDHWIHCWYVQAKKDQVFTKTLTVNKAKNMTAERVKPQLLLWAAFGSNLILVWISYTHKLRQKKEGSTTIRSIYENSGSPVPALFTSKDTQKCSTTTQKTRFVVTEVYLCY